MTQKPLTDAARSLAARGILAGVALQLHVYHGEADEILSTVLEEVAEDRLEVLVPISRRQVRRIPVGTVVRCDYSYQKRFWRFVSSVAGHSADGAYEYLSLPETVENTDRRGSFRLLTSIQPIDAERIVEDPVGGDTLLAPLTKPLILDLSEGGLCLSCHDGIVAEERLCVRLRLGDQGELSARLRVTSVEQPGQRSISRKAHCRFEDMSRMDRNRIARYIMSRQIEMRRAGKI